MAKRKINKELQAYNSFIKKLKAAEMRGPVNEEPYRRILQHTEKEIDDFLKAYFPDYFPNKKAAN